MAQPVIDQLELVQVNEQQRKGLLVLAAPGPLQAVVDALGAGVDLSYPDIAPELLKAAEAALGPLEPASGKNGSEKNGSTRNGGKA
mgnify:CR=1 FL=1